MSDLSKSDLKKKIQSILKDADLETTSAKKVRKELEDDLDADLTDRKDEINKIIQEVMDELEKKSDDEGSEEEAEAEEEEQESEEESPKKKNGNSVIRQQESSEDEEAAPSDGGGSDYEPDSGDAGPAKKKKAGRRAAPAASARKRKSRGGDDSGDESASSGEEWGSAKKKKKAPAAGKRRRKAASESNGSDSDFKPSKVKTKRKGGGNSAFTRPLKLSDDLADIIGKDMAPRHEVVKQMWAYIKENKLQDPKNRQFAICDEKLKKVIGEKKFKCFGMAKYLKHHMS